jgi:hypothetical protein
VRRGAATTNPAQYVTHEMTEESEMFNRVQQINIDQVLMRKADDAGRLYELANSRAELDRRLDDALEETFPASDPISIMVC